MNCAWHRVASRTSSTRSRPVANGSSVPAWPVFCPRSRRTRATTSWEVMPACLSASSTPGSAASAVMPRTLRRAQLRLHLGAEDLQELVVRLVGREAGGTRVAAAPVALSDRGDVDRARRRAQAHLARVHAAIALVADHRGHLGALERPHVVDDALGERFARAGLAIVISGDVGDGEAALIEPLDPLDRPCDEVKLFDWDALV